MPSYSPGKALFDLASFLLPLIFIAGIISLMKPFPVPISSQETRLSVLPLCPHNIPSQAFPNFFTSWYTCKMLEAESQSTTVLVQQHPGTLVTESWYASTAHHGVS